MTPQDRTTQTLLWLHTGLLWEPRFDPAGNVFMWVKPDTSPEGMK